MTETIEDLRRNIRECIHTDREKAKALLGILADELEDNHGEIVRISRGLVSEDLPQVAALSLGAIGKVQITVPGIRGALFHLMVYLEAEQIGTWKIGHVRPSDTLPMYEKYIYRPPSYDLIINVNDKHGKPLTCRNLVR